MNFSLLACQNLKFSESPRFHRGVPSVLCFCNRFICLSSSHGINILPHSCRLSSIFGDRESPNPTESSHCRAAVGRERKHMLRAVEERVPSSYHPDHCLHKVPHAICIRFLQTCLYICSCSLDNSLCYLSLDLSFFFRFPLDLSSICFIVLLYHMLLSMAQRFQPLPS